jgi:hypothetical protein
MVVKTAQNQNPDSQKLLKTSVRRWLNFAVWAARSSAQTAKNRSARSARGTIFRTCQIHVLKGEEFNIWHERIGPPMKEKSLKNLRKEKFLPIVFSF